MNDDRNRNNNRFIPSPSSERPSTAEKPGTTYKSSITQPVVIQESKRSTAGLWGAIVLLFAALVGLGGYGYLAMQDQGLALSDLPGMKETSGLLADRLDAAEAQFNSWSERFGQLGTRVDKLDQRIAATRAQAKKDSQEMVAQLQSRIQDELAERDRTVDARFNQLESSQQDGRMQMTQLQKQVNGVRTDSDQQLAQLRSQVARGEHNLDALAQQLDHRRVDFELSKENTRELAPGVSLRVTKTDVRRQQVKGWVWLMPDRRTLWVRDLGLQQPLVFYQGRNEQPNELVITRVTDEAVIGYLLLPASSEVNFGASAQRAPASQPSSETGGL